MDVFTLDIEDSLGVHFSVNNYRFSDLTENSDTVVNDCIAFWELLAVILVIMKFINELQGENIVFFIDNGNVCLAIEKYHDKVNILHRLILV